MRGTTRTLEKGNVVKAALEKKHGSSAIVEIIVVEEMDEDGAFDEAVKGEKIGTPPILRAIVNNSKVFPVSSMLLPSYHSM